MRRMQIVMPVLLAAQTATMVLTTRYTRTVQVEGPRYLSTSVILLSELTKLLACLLWLYSKNSFRYDAFCRQLRSDIVDKPIEMMKVAVPSGIYALQNNLLFIAISYLDAPTYQVTYQLKILTTAMFSVILMRKQIGARQWLALFILMIGVICVQYRPDEASSANVEEVATGGKRYIGFIVLLLACTSSGFAGVYFEYILKSSSLSLVLRNIQMAFFGVIFSGFGAWWYDGEKIAEHGLLQGYNFAVVVVLLLQAFGGLLVASVVQHTNNLVKVFAASLSLIVSSFVSYFVFHDLSLSLQFMLGTVLVIFATFLYGYRPQQPGKMPGVYAKPPHRQQVKTS